MSKIRISRSEAKARGLKRFYVGPCSKGHDFERLVSNSKCLKCTDIALALWKRSNPERVAQGAAKYHAGLRLQCTEVLGTKCECCGESEPVFLAIDHRHGGGNDHRKIVGRAARFFKWFLEAANMVGSKAMKEEFRLLCHNCNMAMSVLGYCPHQKVIHRG